MMHRTYITTGERIRTYLALAFLLSLLLNAASTLVMPDLTRIRADDAPPPTVTIDHRHPSIARTPPPTPPPTPAPRRPQHAVSKPIAVAVPHTSAVSPHGPVARPYVAPKTAGADAGNGPDAIGSTAPLATALPATPAPQCATPNQEASVTDAVAPDYPDSARGLGYGLVSVLVEVTLDAKGSLTEAKIAQSSGNAALDASALQAARESTYAPKIVNCEPAAGTYIFRADFQ